MCLQYSNATMFAQIFSATLHIPLCILFVKKWDYEVNGLGIASSITYISMYIFVTIYSHCLKDIKEALFFPTRDSFLGWGQYLQTSIPSVIMMCAEGWAFQVMGIFAGLISVND